MDSIKKYETNVIAVIENMQNELRRKIYSKNIFDILMRKTYKDWLNKYDKFLIECYKNYEKLIDDSI